MMKIHHVGAGARSSTRLVRDENDRLELLRRFRDDFGPALLAYCIMDTHLHLVAEGEAEVLVELLASLLRGHGAGFLRRHGLRGPLLRARPTTQAVLDERELARTIFYVHDNPVKAKATSKQLEWRWSSAAEFAGLSVAGIANVARARELLGAEVGHVVKKMPTLVGLEMLEQDTPELAVLLAAAARTLGTSADLALSTSRSIEAKRTRALFLALADLEQHPREASAAFLGLTRQHAWNVKKCAPARTDALRVARTLARTPGFRRCLVLPTAVAVEDGAPT